MVLIKRFSRLLRADMHAMLDNLEDPGMLLRQSLRDMAEALELDRRHLQTMQQRIEHLRGRRDELDSQSQDLASEIDSCFKADREDLMRVLLRRRLENDALSKALAAQLQALQRERDDTESQIQDRSARFETVQKQAEVFDTVASDCSEFDGHCGQIRIPDADVELALLQERERRAAL